MTRPTRRSLEREIDDLRDDLRADDPEAVLNPIVVDFGGETVTVTDDGETRELTLEEFRAEYGYESREVTPVANFSETST